MRLYAAFIPAHAPLNTPGSLSRADLVRTGFNWLAFFFAPFWAIANGLWLTALGVIAAYAAAIVLPQHFGLDPVIQACLVAGIAVFCGFSGSDWRQAGLARQGFALYAVIAARDREHAFMRLCEAVDMEGPESAPSNNASPEAPLQPAALDLGPSPGFWS